MSRPILPKGVSRQLERLNALTTGPGALRLPARVSQLDLQFFTRVTESSLGAKRFWRQTLPPIQFYNPTVPISVRRYADGSAPQLTVSFEDGTSTAIDVAGMNEATILERLVEATGAEPIPSDQQTLLRPKRAGE